MAEVFREVSAYAQGEVGRLAEAAAARAVAARTLVAHGKPAGEIVRVAREEQVDMIVLGTHGKGLLDTALFGSTTERVVRKAPCPVLTCRPAEHDFVD
jgi:nucleotide-binding universal stress UspA family protein